MYQFYWQVAGEKESSEFGSLGAAQTAMDETLSWAESPFYLAIIYDGTTVQEVEG